MGNSASIFHRVNVLMLVVVLLTVFWGPGKPASMQTWQSRLEYHPSYFYLTPARIEFLDKLYLLGPLMEGLLIWTVLPLRAFW